MWRSLDLFSGIGGITHGLRGLCHPVAYCDIELHAREVIRARIKSRDLPRAPICEDVRLMGKEWLAKNRVNPKDVDIIVAGFPCTGMSTAGKREGLADAGSSLFFEITRIIDEVQPKALFFENSNNIINLGYNGIQKVLKELTSRGYEVRYIVMGAHSLGAPHHRRRWYCLALKQNAIGNAVGSNKGAGHNVARFEWSYKTEPPRTAKIDGRHDDQQRRIQRLGLSVVPDVVRCAFTHLALGFRSKPSDVWGVKSLVHVAGLSMSSSDKEWSNVGTKFPKSAFIKGESMQIHDDISKSYADVQDFKLLIVPTSYVSAKPPSPLATKLHTNKWRFSHWGTPSYQFSTPANYITQRSQGNLMTQIRFEKHTRSRHDPISPEFIEWMMGFPPRWTLID
jgi:DNA-cytosine methyltransferase